MPPVEDQSGRNIAAALIMASYSETKSFSYSRGIQALCLLRDYTERSSEMNFDANSHELRQRIRRPGGYYDPLSYLADAPSLKDLTRCAVKIKHPVIMMGRLVRFMLILQKHNSDRATIDGAVTLYGTFYPVSENKLEKTQTGRDADTLKRLWRTYSGVPGLCFAMILTEKSPEELWLDKVASDETDRINKNSSLALTVLRRVSPAKKNKNYANDDWDTTHLQLGNDSVQLSPSEYTETERLIGELVKATQDEIDAATAYPSAR